MKSAFSHLSRKLWLLLVFVSVNGLVLAQESGGSSSTTTSTTSSSTDIKVTADGDNAGEWYTSPWVWVLAGLGFILLLVALLRGGSNRTASTTGTTDRVTVTKTVSRDTDVQ